MSGMSERQIEMETNKELLCKHCYKRIIHCWDEGIPFVHFKTLDRLCRGGYAEMIGTVAEPKE